MIKILQKNSIGLIIIMVCFLAFTAGCDRFKKKSVAPVAPPPAVMAQQKPVATVSVLKPLSSVKLAPASTNQFDFSTKKDPFKPFAIVKAPEQGSDNKKPVKELLPIHSFDMSQFKLAGVVTDSKGNKAMVMDPNGKAYVLKVGMTIGKAEGKITQITTSGIEVVEQFRDDNGKVRKETIKIPLLRKP